jgi:hypothetical protein
MLAALREEAYRQSVFARIACAADFLEMSLRLP